MNILNDDGTTALMLVSVRATVFQNEEDGVNCLRSVADPGFPRLEGANLFSLKLHKMNKFGSTRGGGGATLCHPLHLPMRLFKDLSGVKLTLQI